MKALLRCLTFSHFLIGHGFSQRNHIGGTETFTNFVHAFVNLICFFTCKNFFNQTLRLLCEKLNI